VDVEQAVTQLRAVRHFANRPLSEGDLRAVLEAGRHTGSSKNLQPWTFLVIVERERLRALSRVGDFAGHLAGAAAAIALITPDPHAPNAPLSITWDVGRAAQNMMLAALSRGVGSVPATVYDQALCRSILGYPQDHHCEHLLSLGYPANAEMLGRRPRAGGRLPLAEVVRWERW
jgi:nitroreductase